MKIFVPLFTLLFVSLINEISLSAQSSNARPLVEFAGLLGGRGTLNNAVFAPGFAVQTTLAFPFQNEHLIGPSVGVYRFSSIYSFPISLSILLNNQKQSFWDFKLGYAFSSDRKYHFDENLNSKNGFFFSAGFLKQLGDGMFSKWKINLDILQTGARYETTTIQSNTNSTYVFVRMGFILGRLTENESTD